MKQNVKVMGAIIFLLFTVVYFILTLIFLNKGTSGPTFDDPMKSWISIFSIIIIVMTSIGILFAGFKLFNKKFAAENKQPNIILLAVSGVYLFFSAMILSLVNSPENVYKVSLTGTGGLKKANNYKSVLTVTWIALAVSVVGTILVFLKMRKQKQAAKVAKVESTSLPVNSQPTIPLAGETLKFI